MSESAGIFLPLERELHELADLEDFGGELARHLSEMGTPLILLLSGEMGVGKTTLIRALNTALGGTSAASPTYALHHRYDLDAGRHLDHWDLYRIADESELDGAGFWEMLEFEQDLWAVEWPDKVPVSYWPKGKEIWHLELEKLQNGGRLVRIKSIQKLR